MPCSNNEFKPLRQTYCSCKTVSILQLSKEDTFLTIDIFLYEKRLFDSILCVCITLSSSSYSFPSSSPSSSSSYSVFPYSFPCLQICLSSLCRYHILLIYHYHFLYLLISLTHPHFICLSVSFYFSIFPIFSLCVFLSFKPLSSHFALDPQRSLKLIYLHLPTDYFMKFLVNLRDFPLSTLSRVIPEQI